MNHERSHCDVVWSDLERDEDHGGGTLGGGLPGPVPDGVLGLQGEEEDRGEAVRLGDAGQPVGLVQVLGGEVTVSQADHVVDHCNVGELFCRKPREIAIGNTSKEDPGSVETAGKQENHVAPGGVQEGGVEVRDVPPSLLGDIFIRHVGQSAFPHDPLLLVHLPWESIYIHIFQYFQHNMVFLFYPQHLN